MSLKATQILIVAVFITRLIYLYWLCPYELLGDEGYYWEQARHLDWCYNEKGPALAWMIAGCCYLFGTTEFAVRLPVLLSFVLAGGLVSRLAVSVSRGDQRVGFLAALLFFLMPTFQANGQICTQDCMLIAIYIGLAAIGLRILRRWRGEQNVWGEWLVFWALMGVGALFKHTIILFLPGAAFYLVIQRRQFNWHAGLIATQQLTGLCLFLLLISPMIVWNYHHGWPMLEHTIGHLGAGGDQIGQVNRGNPIQWAGLTIAGIVFAFGPAAILLMIWSCIWAWKRRKEDPDRWDNRFWLMCTAWPSMLFFVALSLTKPVVPSWPLVSLGPLLVIVAEFALPQLICYRQRKQASDLSQRREKSSGHKVFEWSWGTLIGYGLCGWLAISFPNLLNYSPIAHAKIEKSIMGRIGGHRKEAAELNEVLSDLTGAGEQSPIIVTRHYMEACIMAFYLPGHPTVTTAGKYLAKRSTTFDQWDDTRLSNPAFHGRSLLLCGKGDIPWERGLIFDSPLALANGQFYLARNYQGPRPDYPRAVPGSD